MPPIAVFTNEGDPALARNRAAGDCADLNRTYVYVNLHIAGVEFKLR